MSKNMRQVWLCTRAWKLAGCDMLDYFSSDENVGTDIMTHACDFTMRKAWQMTMMQTISPLLTKQITVEANRDTTTCTNVIVARLHRRFVDTKVVNLSCTNADRHEHETYGKRRCCQQQRRREGQSWRSQRGQGTCTHACMSVRKEWTY
jgi:hypothetical protein